MYMYTIIIKNQLQIEALQKITIGDDPDNPEDKVSARIAQQWQSIFAWLQVLAGRRVAGTPLLQPADPVL